MSNCRNTNCCNETRIMKEGECVTFRMCFRDALDSMVATKALDQRSPPPTIEPYKENSSGLIASHEVHCADGAVDIKFDATAGSAGDYQVNVTVLTDSCQSITECFILKVVKCR